jgi:hypothetical protein
LAGSAVESVKETIPGKGFKRAELLVVAVHFNANSGVRFQREESRTFSRRIEYIRWIAAARRAKLFGSLFFHHVGKGPFALKR